MSAQVRVADGNTLEVVGHGAFTYLGPGNPTEGVLDIEIDLLTATVEGAGPAGLSSLRQAVIKWRRRYGSPDRTPELLLSAVPGKEFDPYHSDSFGASVFMLDGERLLVTLPRKASAESEMTTACRLLAPLLARHKASIRDVGLGEYGMAGVDWPIRGRTVADAYEFQGEMRALLSAAEGGELTPTTTLDVLRAGRWGILEGQPESSWLDAKGAPYSDLRGNGKYELAKDVAAFANSPAGGLIVLGMTTRKNRDGIDTIHRIKEFELSQVKRQSYRDLVERWVYPRVDGFEVERIEGPSQGRGLAVLVVPPQADASLPFLVQGTYSSDKVLGAHVLLPVRRGDDTTAMDAASMHARLRLGEQAIAGERRNG